MVFISVKMYNKIKEKQMTLKEINKIVDRMEFKCPEKPSWEFSCGWRLAILELRKKIKKIKKQGVD